MREIMWKVPKKHKSSEVERGLQRFISHMRPEAWCTEMSTSWSWLKLMMALTMSIPGGTIRTMGSRKLLLLLMLSKDKWLLLKPTTWELSKRVVKLVELLLVEPFWEGRQKKGSWTLFSMVEGGGYHIEQESILERRGKICRICRICNVNLLCPYGNL